MLKSAVLNMSRLRTDMKKKPENLYGCCVDFRAEHTFVFFLNIFPKPQKSCFTSQMKIAVYVKKIALQNDPKLVDTVHDITANITNK